MQLPPELVGRLGEVLRQAYPEPAGFRRWLGGTLLASHKDDFPERPAYRDAMAELIEAACRGHWIDRLVIAARDDRPSNGELREVAEQILHAVAGWRAAVRDSLDSREQDALLDFLVEHYRGPTDLDDTLGRVGYSHHKRWVDALDFPDNLRRLIAAAHRDGWDRLLAFCTLYDRWTRPGVPQRAAALLTNWEREGLRLLTELNQLSLDDASVVRCYHGALTPQSFRQMAPPGAGESLVHVAYSIVAAQDAASSDPPSPGDDRPLLRFLQRLAGLPGAGPQAETRVAQLWPQLAAALALPGQFQVERGADEEYSVIVELRDGSEWTAGRPIWTRRAWLYHHRAGKYERLDDHLEGRTETPASMPEYLNALRKRLGDWRVGPGGILFEIFLSRRSLNQAIDQWPLLLDEEIPSEFGFENPVALRAVDRRPDLRDKLARRWARLHAAESLDRDQAVALGSRGGLPREHYQAFERKPELQCLVLETPLGMDGNPEEFPCLHAAITAGLPVILWVRAEAALGSLPAQLGHWTATPPRTLPRLVYELRRACPVEDPDHLGRHLTLFFENGDHWLPDDHQATEAR